MTFMPKLQPRYLLREVTRHGKVVWYVRKGAGPRIRLAAEYGTEAFWAEYSEAIAGKTEPTRRKPRSGSLAWLCEQYRQSAAWAALKPATRRQRDNIMRRVLAKAGEEPFVDIDKASILAGMDAKKATPAAARNFLETMRGLFRWAHDAQHIDEDPTHGVRAERKQTDGLKPWSEAEIDAFRRRWPPGTRERLAFDILLYTGLRRGDVARLGKQHVKDGVITLATEKTGQRVTLPILPELAASIEACPSKGLTLISAADGSPLRKESFGNWFREGVMAAGLTGVSAHGLRKAAAIRAAENGATVAEMEALFGWRGGGMASLYTRDADRVRLAKGAAHKLSRETDRERHLPAPTLRPPAPKKKGQ